MEPRNTPVVESGGATPGWYPDPMGRFEFRYYNGERWTADVAQHSNRYIDPIGDAATTLTRPSRAMAVIALVFSLSSLAVAWIPFVFVIGAAGAITAIILGVIVVRRSARNASAGQPIAIGRGMAVGAIGTAVAALALCVVGFQLTRVVLREVDQLVNPGTYDVQIDSCRTENGHVAATGSIRNQDTKTRSYTITIAYRHGGDIWRTDAVSVTDVEPSQRANFTDTSSAVTFTSETVSCTVESVYGPAPFSD